MRIDGYAPIARYGAIGDGHAFALVAEDGSIDWLAVPSMDSPAAMSALLDQRSGGRFVLEPAVPYETSQAYVEDTNVLTTTFTTPDGAVRVTDAFTYGAEHVRRPPELIRRVEGLGGRVPMTWRFEPRADNGQRKPDLSIHEGALLARSREVTLALHCFDAGVPDLSAASAHGEFDVSGGGSALFALHATDGALVPVPRRDSAEARLVRTVEEWRRWTASIRYSGPWRDAVVRSALVLKLLIARSTGAMAAAGTTSLPEALGGDRNWDYRYAWLRDTSFAIDALLALDLDDEAAACLRWVLGVVDRLGPRLQVVLSLDGRIPEKQLELSDLEGYRRSRPVRVGNRAGEQRQLGTYGDVTDSIVRYIADGNLLGARASDAVAGVADFVCDIWRDEDAGIWELQHEHQYSISKIGCWVALDRALSLAERGMLSSVNAERWRREREAVRAYVDNECWSDAKQSYTFYAGTEELDASCLLAARTGFATGRRLEGTVEAVQRELAVGDLVYRYSGMQDAEGAFVACSFWLVEALTHIDRRDEAAELMDRLVCRGGSTGLLSEEIDPGSGDLLGNVPQALTHLSLINAACALARDG